MSALADAVHDLDATLQQAERAQQDAGLTEVTEALTDLAAAARRVVDNWDNC